MDYLNNENNINYLNNMNHNSNRYNYPSVSNIPNTNKPRYSNSNYSEEDLSSIKGIRSESIATFANANSQNNLSNDRFDTKRLDYNQIESNSNPSIANELRISNLERRLDSAEKLLRFYEEMNRLKDEESKNDNRIDNSKIHELNQRINSLEENNNFLNKKILEQNDIIGNKLVSLEKQLERFNEVKNSIGEFYASKLAGIESVINKNDVIVESLIDEKIANTQIDIDGRFDEMLNLINDIAKSTEKSEFSIAESKECVRNVQGDHLELVKILSVLKEKSDNLDFIMSQITELKTQFAKIKNIYENNTPHEEKKFLHKVLGGGNSSIGNMGNLANMGSMGNIGNHNTKPGFN